MEKRTHDDTHLTTLSSRIAIQTRALLVYTDASRTRLFGLGSVHTLLDVGCKAVKRLFNVDVVLGGNLEERNAKLIGKLLTLLGGDRSFLFPITLVADEDLVYAFAGMLLHVGKPGSNVWKRVRSGSDTF